GIRDFHVTGVQTCALPISAADHKHVVGLYVLSCLPPYESWKHYGAAFDSGGIVFLRHLFSAVLTRRHPGQPLKLSIEMCLIIKSRLLSYINQRQRGLATD